MIKGFEKVPYNINSTIPDKLDWYTWTETCDRCGLIIHKNGEFKTTGKPDEGKHYCIKCLRALHKI